MLGNLGWLETGPRAEKPWRVFVRNWASWRTAVSVLSNADEHMGKSTAALRNEMVDMSGAEQEFWVSTRGLLSLLLPWSLKRDLASLFAMFGLSG